METKKFWCVHIHEFFFKSVLKVFLTKFMEKDVASFKLVRINNFMLYMIWYWLIKYYFNDVLLYLYRLSTQRCQKLDIFTMVYLFLSPQKMCWHYKGNMMNLSTSFCSLILNEHGKETRKGRDIFFCKILSLFTRFRG